MRELIIDNPRKAREAVDSIRKQYGSVEAFLQHYEIVVEKGTPMEDIYRLLKYVGGQKDALK